MKRRAAIFLVAFTATVEALGLGSARADSYTACVNDSVLGVHNDVFTVAWRIAVIRTSVGTQKDIAKGSGPPGSHVTINFTPTAMVLNGSGAAQRLQRSQLDSWRPVIEELRAAAANRIQIRVSFDAKSKNVTDLQLLYSQRCP